MPRFFPFLCLASLPVLVCAAPPGGENKAKEPDAAAIARLIEQLGSPVFQERQRATKALEEIGLPALDALRNAAKGNNLEFVQRANRLITIIENGLDSLLADYRSYGLPLPPEDAKLVRFKSLNGQLMPPVYLAFLLQEETQDNPPLLLIGTQQVRLGSRPPIEVVTPQPELVKEAWLNWSEGVKFPMNAGIALAIQCRARGWNDLAQELLRASYPSSSYRDEFAHLAWAYSQNELVKPDSDRTKIAKRMKALLAAESSLKTEKNQALLRSLEATLIPCTSRAGTVERMIDDLIDMCAVNHADPRHARLALMGFAAVPALIEHLDDDRLTRSCKGEYIGQFPIAVNQRVKDVVSDLLQGLAGPEVGWLGRLGGAVEKAAAKDWWNKASKEGEEAYLLRLVLGKDAEWPSHFLLHVITEKYPQHLPKLYRTILEEQPKMQSCTLADAVAKCSLPPEQKREIFLRAANHKNLEHRWYGLRELKERDPQEFMKILLATLEDLPKPTKAYPDCPEKWFAILAKATDDPRAWEMLEKVAKRSDVGLRMEFMRVMEHYSGDSQRQQCLDFLAAFLDDAETRDVDANPRMFNGICAGFLITRLEVRNFAAMQIASILEMPEKPNKTWSPEQWEKLRKKVKETVKR